MHYIANLQIDVVAEENVEQLLIDFARRALGGTKYTDEQGNIKNGNLSGLPLLRLTLNVGDNLTALRNYREMADQSLNPARDRRPYIILEGVAEGGSRFFAVDLLFDNFKNIWAFEWIWPLRNFFQF